MSEYISETSRHYAGGINQSTVMKKTIQVVVAFLIATCFMFAYMTAKGQAIQKCQSTTKAGNPCARKAVTAEGFCSQHNPYADKCKGVTKQGKPCQLTPKRGETYCHYHTPAKQIAQVN